MEHKRNLAGRQAYWNIVLSTCWGREEETRLPASAGAGDSLPVLYLNSNISDNTTENEVQDNLNSLSPYHQKSAFILSENVHRFCALYGLERCGFLTLTFPDNVQDHKEASRRFNNMNRRFLSRFYGEWIWARERQKGVLGTITSSSSAKGISAQGSISRSSTTGFRTEVKASVVGCALEGASSARYGN